MQRWFVRSSKAFITENMFTGNEDLVAVNIVPPSPIVRLGELPATTFSDASSTHWLELALAQL
jgi:hypothetical protein